MNHATYQRARDQRQLTNAALSRILGVSESYICKIMNGVRPVTAKMRAEFCRALGLPEEVNGNGKRKSA